MFYETIEIYLNSQHIGNIIFGIYCSSTKIYEIIGANLGSSVSKATSLELGIAGCLGIHCMDLLALSTPLTSKILAIFLFLLCMAKCCGVHPSCMKGNIIKGIHVSVKA